MTTPLRTRLSRALSSAMKDGDRPKVSAVRTALAAVANAEAVDASGVEPAVGAFASDVERRSLTDAEVDAIVREVSAEMRAASEEMLGLGQQERSQELADQAAALDAILGTPST